MVKQRVRGCLDPMIVDVSLISIQSEWQGIGNEMYLVPAMRQLLPQLGRDDTRSACHRIAGDADDHFPSI